MRINGEFMGTKIKLFNLLITIFASTQLCAMQPWQKWVAGHALAVDKNLLNSGDKKDRRTYDAAIDKLQANNQTVRGYYKKMFKAMDEMALKGFQQEFKISDPVVAKMLQEKKELKKQERKNPTTIKYSDDIPESIKTKIETIAKQHSAASSMTVRLDKDSKIYACAGRFLIDRKNEKISKVRDSKVATLNVNSNFLAENDSFQSAALHHEIGGHIKHYDLLELTSLNTLFAHQYIDLKMLFDSQALKELRAFQEWRADQKPGIKDLETALIMEKGWKAAREKLATSDIDASGDMRYQCAKTTRKLLEAEKRWMWGQKGYEKYGDQYYDNAFVNHHNNLAKTNNKRFWEFWK